MAIIAETDIFMIRVGESEAIAQGIVAGNQLNPSLSKKGVRDATEAGNTLVRILKERDIRQVHILTEDSVIRMFETTNLVVDKLFAAGIGYTRQSDGRLGGKNQGIRTGSNRQQRREDPQLLAEKAKRNQMTTEERFKTAVEGAECGQEIADKTMKLFQDHRKTLVVVTSNNTLEALSALLNLEKPYEKMKIGYADILHLKQSDQVRFSEVIKA